VFGVEKISYKASSNRHKERTAPLASCMVVHLTSPLTSMRPPSPPLLFPPRLYLWPRIPSLPRPTSLWSRASPVSSVLPRLPLLPLPGLLLFSTPLFLKPIKTSARARAWALWAERLSASSAARAVANASEVAAWRATRRSREVSKCAHAASTTGSCAAKSVRRYEEALQENVWGSRELGKAMQRHPLPSPSDGWHAASPRHMLSLRQKER